jgi:triosephosphate isomerase (TIM)
MKTVVANWKMNVGVRESVALARGTLLTVRGRKIIPEIIICPPFVALGEVRKVVARSVAMLGAQNMSSEESGSFTGEISPRMLQELGVSHVILGHSERRNLYGETDELVAKKVQQAFSHKLVPIICVGESAEQRDAGEEKEIVRHQLAVTLSQVHLRGSDICFIAYEPVWAIGTGRSADIGDVLEMHAFIKEVLSDIFPDALAKQLRVLYGGSVNGENAYQFFREKEVDGVLVGGASVKLNQFREIVDAAAEVLEAQT